MFEPGSGQHLVQQAVLRYAPFRIDFAQRAAAQAFAENGSRLDRKVIGRNMLYAEPDRLSEVLFPLREAHLRDAVNQVHRQVFEAGPLRLPDGPHGRCRIVAPVASTANRGR